MIREAGGKYIAGGFNKATTLTGAAPPNRVILIQYDNMDALMKAWEGGLRGWQEKNGDKYATFRALAIESSKNKSFASTRGPQHGPAHNRWLEGRGGTCVLIRFRD
jgi:uncharacterized protein (DUF1330 family)